MDEHRARPSRTRTPWTPAWWLPLLLVAASIWPYLSMPVDTVRSQAIYDGLLLSAAVFLVLAARRIGGRESAPVWAFSAAAAVYLCGDLAWYAIYYRTGAPPSSASIADVGYAGYYLILAVAFLLLLRLRSPGRDVAGLLDGLIVAIGLSMLIWVYVVLPIAASSAFSWIGWAVSVTYPVLDIAVLFVAARLVTAPGPRPFSFALLLSALMLLLAADTWYGFHLAEGTFVAGGILDLAWPTVFMLIAAAFLHPSAPQMLTMADPVVDTSRSALRFIILASALLVPTIVAALARTQTQKGIALITGLILFVLVVARFWQMAGSLDRAHSKFRALVQNAEDIILVIDEHATITYRSPSADAVLGPCATLYDCLDPGDRQAFESVAASLEQGCSAVLDVRLCCPDRRAGNFSAVITNLTGDSEIRGYVLNLRDVTDRVELEKELRYQAMHDQLTGLPNRALFADRVRQALLGCARDGGQVALMIVDLDGFKQTNDVYGHAAGDRVLREVASAMRDCVRVSDTVARLGGDEFGVLVVPAESGETLAATADRLRRHVGRGEVSCSIGVALGTAQDCLDALTAAADRALYQAKRAGRNRCVIAASAREAVR